MASQNFVNFKKVRSLGDMLSDTFKFLQTQWQPFFITIVKVAIVPVIIAIAAAIYFLTKFVPFYGEVMNLTNLEGGLEGINFNFSSISLPFVLYGFCYLFAYALVTVAALSFIKSYIENRGIVNYTEIQNDIKSKLWSCVGLFILILSIVMIGSLFCFLPGIYFWVVLTLSTPILIFQSRGVLDSISDAFILIRDNWWQTFGILIVVQILIMVTSYITGLPASKYFDSSIQTFIQNQDLAALTTVFLDPIYLIFIVFSHIVNFILYIISTIVTVFIYFDIKEQNNPTSDDIIDEIGIS